MLVWFLNLFFSLLLIFVPTSRSERVVTPKQSHLVRFWSYSSIGSSTKTDKHYTVLYRAPPYNKLIDRSLTVWTDSRLHSCYHLAILIACRETGEESNPGLPREASQILLRSSQNELSQPNSSKIPLDSFLRRSKMSARWYEGS